MARLLINYIFVSGEMAACMQREKQRFGELTARRAAFLRRRLLLPAANLVYERNFLCRAVVVDEKHGELRRGCQRVACSRASSCTQGALSFPAALRREA